MEFTKTGIGHPLADIIVGRIACVRSRAPIVYLSEAFADFLVWSQRNGLRAVVVTPAETVLTFTVRYHLEMIGGIWAVEEPGESSGLINTGDGLLYHSLAELDFAAGEPVAAVPAEPEVLQAVFSVVVQHAPTLDLQLGKTAELLAEHLAGEKLVAWGAHEPSLLAWDAWAFTESVRSRMPEARTTVTSDSSGFHAVSGVRRNRTGVEETTTGIARVASLGTDFASVGQTAANALTVIADELSMPVLGTISVGPGRRDLSYSSAPLPAATPAAVLIGPRAVRAMDIDVDTLSREFSLHTAGRKRLPSVITTFTDSGVSPWLQATQLAEAIGIEALTRAFARPGQGSGAGPGTSEGDA